MHEIMFFIINMTYRDDVINHYDIFYQRLMGKKLKEELTSLFTYCHVYAYSRSRFLTLKNYKNTTNKHRKFNLCPKCVKTSKIWVI